MSRISGWARWRGAWALAAIMMLTTMLGAAGCRNTRSPRYEVPVVKLEYEKYTLPNGLEVILRRDNRLPLVAVNLWYHVGPANETAGRTGFAHLFEHMMFQGSAHVESDGHFRLLESAGASLINGTTDFDRTNYLEDVPSNQLELALWLESDRMGFLLDRLDEAMLANQQDVVRNERRQSVENAPYGLADEELWHRLFPKGHPYYASVIGSHDDIQAAKLADVEDFFRKYYTPNNATIAIVGDIDVAKTKALLEKYFGSIPRGQDVPPVKVDTPSITQEVRYDMTDQVELPRVYMAWQTAPIFKPGDAEAIVASRILGGGKASRLYKTLVYDKKIAQNVSAYQQSLTLGSVFQVMATAKPGVSLDELEAAIEREIDTLGTVGPTAEELDAAKNAITSSMVMDLEEIGGFGGVANRLNHYNHHLGDPGYLNEDLKRYGAVTAAQVKDLVAAQLQQGKRVVVRVTPGEKHIPSGPPTPPKPTVASSEIVSKEPWRKDVPKAGPPSITPLPSATTFKLDNGLTVYLVEYHTLPVVAAELVVRSGSADDPVPMPGLAAFTTSMLDEGTQTRDALGLAREVESIGAQLGSNTISDGSFLSIRSLKTNIGRALDILSDVAVRPTFPENEVERVRNDRKTAILQERDSPFQTALRVTTASLFGADHPYGHVPTGTEASLAKISRQDLSSFYISIFTPDNSALVLAGDLTRAEARRLADEHFGKWTGKRTAPDRKPEPATIPERVVVVDKPGAPQTMMLLAQLGVQRSDPDFEKLDLMNQVLGGAFTSRVNLNLREKNGYTYGAFSALVERRRVGPLYVGADVRTDVTGPAIDETLKEMKSLLAGEMTADELRLAKESISRTLPARFQTTESTVGTIGQLHLLDLPPDYYQGLPARLDAVTGAEVFAATKKVLSPDRALVVAIGDRRQILPQIAKLKLGPVTYRTPDGAPTGETALAGDGARRDVRP